MFFLILYTESKPTLVKVRVDGGDLGRFAYYVSLDDCSLAFYRMVMADLCPGVMRGLDVVNELS